LDGVILPHFI